MPQASNGVVDILIVEDNPGDVRLIREALKESTRPHHLHCVPCGEAALAFLRHEDNYEDAPRPHLIVLDLNLPGRPGLEILQEIRRDDALRSIPVLILTASDAESDIQRSYEAGANCLITKPLSWEAFTRSVRTIEEFWLQVVTLPSRG